MTRTEICDLFISRGFNLREVRGYDWIDIEHNGEQVGRIYEDSVNIVHNYPSLRPSKCGSYANTPDTCVLFMSPMTELEKAIEFLLDSPRRLEQETREKRIADVRKYFEDKAIEKKWSV